MSGPELLAYLDSSAPGLGKAAIAHMAGITPPAVHAWARGSRPEYKHVKRLAEHLAYYRPELRVNARHLFEKAGYELPPDPEAASLKRIQADWGKIAAQFAEAPPWKQRQVLNAAREILG